MLAPILPKGGGTTPHCPVETLDGTAGYPPRGENLTGAPGAFPRSPAPSCRTLAASLAVPRSARLPAACRLVGGELGAQGAHDAGGVWR